MSPSWNRPERAVIHLVEEGLARPLRRVLEQVLGAGHGFGGEVLAADLQGEDAGAGAGVIGAAAGLVREAAAVLDGAPLDVGDRAVDVLGGDLAARPTGRRGGP